MERTSTRPVLKVTTSYLQLMPGTVKLETITLETLVFPHRQVTDTAVPTLKIMENPLSHSFSFRPLHTGRVEVNQNVRHSSCQGPEWYLCRGQLRTRWKYAGPVSDQCSTWSVDRSFSHSQRNFTILSNFWHNPKTALQLLYFV